MQSLDLAFNHLTDAGLTMLGDALCRKLVDVDFIWCAFDLAHLYVGGNSALTDGGIEQLRRRLREAGAPTSALALTLMRTLTPTPTITLTLTLTLTLTRTGGGGGHGGGAA